MIIDLIRVNFQPIRRFILNLHKVNCKLLLNSFFFFFNFAFLNFGCTFSSQDAIPANATVAEAPDMPCEANDHHHYDALFILLLSPQVLMD